MVDLEELRARVERRRQVREAAQLQAELANEHIPIDPGVVYLTVEDVRKQMRCSQEKVLIDIRKGLLRARRARTGGKNRYIVHPDDARDYIARRGPARTRD